MNSDNYDCAFDRLSDLLWEDKETDKIKIFERVIGEFRLTDIEKAKLFELVLLNYDE